MAKEKLLNNFPSIGDINWRLNIIAISFRWLLLSAWILSIFFWLHAARAQTVDQTTELLPTISSFSTNFISVTSASPYQTTIAAYGDNLDFLLDEDVTITLGPLTANSVAGNSTGMNIGFTIDASTIDEEQADWPMVIALDNLPVLVTTTVVTIYNPYQSTYQRAKPQRFLNNTARPKQRSKQTIGLNVQWALGSDSTLDNLYEQRLNDSKTIWAREHFSYKLLMGDDSDAWLKRYDQIMLRYQTMGVRVVGMLAYGTAEDELAAPNSGDWKRFVRLVVKRYRNTVDAWEIWNEPDSDDYLQPNTWQNYRPLLKIGSTMVREYDPEAIVLNGAVADITQRRWLRQLYSNGQRYFDELNVHLYYCDEWRDDGWQLTRLEEDWTELLATIQPFRSNEAIWVTELGCSTGLTDINQKTVKRYFQQVTKFLLANQNLLGAKYRLRPILLYTIRDRTYLEPYEAYFGLLKDTLSPKRAWRWYKLLPQS